MMPPDDIDHAALVSELTAALRKDTPPGLSPEQRQLIAREAAKHAPKPQRLRRLGLVACAILLMAPGAAYYGLVRPEQLRVAAEQAAQERLAQEREREAARLAEQSELKLKRAQDAAAEQAALADVLEAAQRLEAQKQSAKLASPCSLGRPCRSGSAKASAKSSGKAAIRRAAGASGKCDPNDPLCGL